MGKETSIAWTDHTFNPWWGCTKVSAGCDNCYAETFDKRVGGDHWGTGKPRREFGAAHWGEPRRWNFEAERDGVRRRVFCASMADVLDPEAPEGARDRLWRLIDTTPALDWLLLTKRPQLYERYLPSEGFRLGNVRLGCTAENQEMWDQRVRVTVFAAAMIAERSHAPIETFVSYEPALGPVRMERTWLPDQVIFGGETGPGRRPTSEAWARSMLAQCKRYKLAFFMKQMSAQTPAKAAELIPADLLIQERS